MSKYALTASQVEAYRGDGCLFPLDGFDAAGVESLWQALAQARVDAEDAGLGAELPGLLRTNAHLVLPFVYRAACTPRLLDRVESILGPDLLLWSAEFFIKPAQSDKIVSWHQDLTYWGLGETDDEVTLWLALSEVSGDSGCMRFIPGSQRRPILPHEDSFAADNMLSRGQRVAVEVNAEDAVDVILRPGQFSLHHGRMFHASGPNRVDRDRIGLAFRYLTPRVRQQVAARDYAMLVRGSDNSGNWIHVAPPARNFDPAALAQRAEVQAVQQAALAAGATKPLHASD